VGINILAPGLWKYIILFEQKKIKLRNKWHFVENKTDNAACLKNAVNFLAA
jgi:hypothetical protein